jgi:hypothetical protein
MKLYFKDFVFFLIIYFFIFNILFLTNSFLTYSPQIDEIPFFDSFFLIKKNFDLYKDFQSSHGPMLSYYLYFIYNIIPLDGVEILNFRLFFLFQFILSTYFISNFFLTKNSTNKKYLIFLFISLGSVLLIPALGNGLIRPECLGLFFISILFFILKNNYEKNIFGLYLFGLFLCFIIFSSPRFILIYPLVFFYFFFQKKTDYKRILLSFLVISFGFFTALYLIFSIVSLNDFINNVILFNSRELIFSSEEIINYFNRLDHLKLFLFTKYSIIKYSFISIFFLNIFINIYFYLKNNKKKIIENNFITFLILTDFILFSSYRDGAQQSFFSLSLLIYIYFIFTIISFYNLFTKIFITLKDIINRLFKNLINFSFKIFFILSLCFVLFLIYNLKNFVLKVYPFLFDKKLISEYLFLSASNFNHSYTKKSDYVLFFDTNYIASNLITYLTERKKLCNSLNNSKILIDWENSPICTVPVSYYRAQYRFYMYQPKIVEIYGEINILNDVKKKPVIIHKYVLMRVNKTIIDLPGYVNSKDFEIIQKILNKDYYEYKNFYIKKNFAKNLL